MTESSSERVVMSDFKEVFVSNDKVKKLVHKMVERGET